MKVSDYCNGVQHIGIPTNDMERTVEFYQGLGFEVVYQPVNGTEKVSFLQQGNHLMIEVYENGHAAMHSGAIDHIAINVSDISAVYELLEKAHYSIVEDAVQYLPFWECGVKYFNIVGPNEERIEFCQKL